MLIDVDPTRRSNRAELAVLHHDLAHNPENGFNFQIQWLGATARLVDELVQSWTRAVERYGLHLVEAPIAQIKDAGQQNLFHAPLQIRLAKPPPPYHVLAPLLERARCSRGTPPAPANEMEQWLFRHVLSHYMTQADQLFEIALLRHFHFVLDQEAMSRFPKHVDVYYSSRAANFDHTQFVHRSGVAFVQVLGGGDGFLWCVCFSPADTGSTIACFMHPLHLARVPRPRHFLMQTMYGCSSSKYAMTQTLSLASTLASVMLSNASRSSLPTTSQRSLHPCHIHSCIIHICGIPPANTPWTSTVTTCDQAGSETPPVPSHPPVFAYSP